MRRTIVYILEGRGGAIGNPEKHAFALCAALAERHDVHVLADQAYGVACPKTASFHALDLSRSRLNPLLYWQVAHYVRQIAPDIIHAQSHGAAVLVRWLKWLYRPGVFVVTLHDHKKTAAYAYKGMDGVCTVNNLRALDFPLERVCRLLYSPTPMPPGLSAKVRQGMRASLRPGADAPLVLAVGRLTPVKGFDVLLRAFVGVDACLLIAGEGPERPFLQQLVQELGLQERVRILGAGQDVRTLLQSVDLCVVSSLREPVPEVMVDALLLGCPLISTELAGVQDWLPPSLLAPANNVEALHALLCATLRRLPLLRKNYLPLFLRARQELTIEGMAQRTENFYEHLLELHQ